VSALLIVAIIVLPAVNVFAILVFAIALFEHLSTGQRRQLQEHRCPLVPADELGYRRHYDKRRTDKTPDSLP